MARMLTPSDLLRTLGAGMTTEAAARMLRCAARTVRRAAIEYAIPLNPRHARIKGEAEWRAAYEEHGTVMALARAYRMSHSYVHRMLEEHGIRDMVDPWVEAGNTVDVREHVAIRRDYLVVDYSDGVGRRDRGRPEAAE